MIEDDNIENDAAPVIDLPSDPVLRKVITDGIAEIISSKIRAGAERDLQKEICDKVKKTTGVKPAQVRQWANWKFKGDNAAAEAAAKITSSEAALEILFNPAAVQTPQP